MKLIASDPAGMFQRIRLPDGFDPSWVGENPFGEGFCIGSENGAIALTDLNGRPQHGLKKVSAAEEAINGIAWSKNWLAATTHADINLIGPWGSNGTEDSHASVIGAGAFGVTTAPSGHFIVPLGRGGIMFIKPSTGPHDPFAVTTAKKLGANIYSALALPGNHSADLIVFAGRRSGVGFTIFDPVATTHAVRIADFHGLDIVDVCSMATSERPRAVAAVSKEGALILFDDILTDVRPVTIRFQSITGTAYRVMSVRGDVFVLTSTGLFGLMYIAKRFLENHTVKKIDIEISMHEIEAADASIVKNRWLVAAGSNEVCKFDIQLMPRSAAEVVQADQKELPEEVNGELIWEESEMDRSERELAVC